MAFGTSVSVIHSVRAKLLALLVLLSLPLLIVSLIQLRHYRRNLNEQESALARTALGAAMTALDAWLTDHPAAVADASNISRGELSQLQGRLQIKFLPDSDTAITIYDARGSVVTSVGPPAAALPVANLLSEITHPQWSDGVVRATTGVRAQPSGWVIVVGVAPLDGKVSGGASLVVITATWGFALISSSLLAVWAVGRYTKPVRQLAATVSSFGEGNLQERAPVETLDEFGTLAEGFNEMAGHLEERFAEVRTQRAFIEEVIDSLPLGLAVLDENLNLRRANPTFARFVNRDAAALSGRNLYEVAGGLSVLSEMVEEVRGTRKSFVAYGLAIDLRSPQTAAAEQTGERGNYWDLTLWPITEQGSGPGDLILILSEVSKRVRAERLATAAFAAERSRAAELESLINQMSEGVVIVDRQGRYRVNPAAAAVIGRAEFRDGVNALLQDLALLDAGGEKLAPERTPLYRALLRGERVREEQLKIRRADGELRTLSVSATPLVGEDERRDGAVAILRDITERVRQHEELVASYDRLREHDRLKSAFVATVSHEFRTPLNVIIGICQLLERDPKTPLAPLQSEAVERMERNARALLGLVNGLLEYSRLEAGRAALHLESVNVGEVVEAVAQEHRSAAVGKGLTLRTAVAPDLGEVITDRQKLTQVISNLVSNAIKFTSVGSVTIVAATEEGQRWRLDVRDTGIGITPEALSYVFDEFRQGDDTLTRAYGGTGLGLAITRRIVELLDGKIAVESRPNQGSSFRVTWPRASNARTGTGSLIGRAPAGGGSSSSSGGDAAALQRQAG